MTPLKIRRPNSLPIEERRYLRKSFTSEQFLKFEVSIGRGSAIIRIAFTCELMHADAHDIWHLCWLDKFTRDYGEYVALIRLFFDNGCLFRIAIVKNWLTLVIAAATSHAIRRRPP